MNGSEVPPLILLHWYECGRKARFYSPDEARRRRRLIPHIYSCPHDDGGDPHWHVAHKPKADDAPDWLQVSKARFVWNVQAYTERTEEHMIQPLNWHGSAHCLKCDWKFDERGTIKALDMDTKANTHYDNTKHYVTTRLHRLDFCAELGCDRKEGDP